MSASTTSTSSTLTTALPSSTTTPAESSTTTPTDPPTSTSSSTSSTSSISSTSSTSSTSETSSSSSTSSSSTTSSSTESSSSSSSSSSIPSSTSSTSSTQPSSSASSAVVPPASSSSTTTTAPPRTSTSLIPSTSFQVFTSGDKTYTSTVVHTLTSTGPAPTTSSKDGGSKPFFQNTAAVAGTFSAVGVVALIALIWLATAWVRRRRARRFDDEVEEAAAEAYKSAEARPYADDDDDFLGPASHHTGFSNETHGTYGQPPLSHGESYGMTDLSPPPGGYGVPTGYQDSNVGPYAVAGAAGLGAGTGMAAMQRQKSMRDAHVTPSAPHHAFAGPPEGTEWDPYGNINTPYMTTQQQQQHAGYPAYPRNDGDLLVAAGLGDHMSGAAATSLAHNPSRRSAAQAAQQRGVSLSRSPSHVPQVQHQGADGLQRNRSLSLEADYFDPAQVQPQQAVVSHTSTPSSGGSSSAAHARRRSSPPPMPESYASHYAPPAEDPYGGYVAGPTGPAARSQDSHGDRRRSRYTSSHYSDGEEDERADSPEPRVLRIANQ